MTTTNSNTASTGVEDATTEFENLNLNQDEPYQWLKDNPWQDYQAKDFLNKDFVNLISCSNKYPVDKKWKQGGKIDLQKVYEDLPTFLQEMEEKKSNSYSELEQVIFTLLTDSKAKNVKGKLRDNPALPLTREIINKKEENTPSQNKSPCEDQYTAQEMEEKKCNSYSELEQVIQEILTTPSPELEDVISKLRFKFSSFAGLEQEIRELLKPTITHVVTEVKKKLPCNEKELKAALLADVPKDIVDQLNDEFSSCSDLRLIKKLPETLLQDIPKNVKRKLRDKLSQSSDKIDQVISQLKLGRMAEGVVSNLRGGELPLTREMIDKKEENTPSQNKSRCKDRYTAQSIHEPDLTNTEYGIEKIDVDGHMLKVSVPEHKKDLLKESGFTSDKRPNLTRRWIFIPSYMRANCGLFDWRNTGIDEEITIRILVVRPSEFQKYQKHCGNHLPIISLPQNEIGVGYARYCIQKIATSIGLEYIWMLDDDIKQFYEIHPKRKPPPPSPGKTKYDPRRRNFDEVFTKFESIVKVSEDGKLAAISPVVFDPKKEQNRKDPPFVRKPPRGAVFLNLKLINDVSYRPQLVAFEDMLFGKECEKKGLKVIMWKWIQFFSITNWKKTGCQSPYLGVGGRGGGGEEEEKGGGRG